MVIRKFTIILISKVYNLVLKLCSFEIDHHNDFVSCLVDTKTRDIVARFYGDSIIPDWEED